MNRMNFMIGYSEGKDTKISVSATPARLVRNVFPDTFPVRICNIGK